jgi:hypothetical protein
MSGKNQTAHIATAASYPFGFCGGSPFSELPAAEKLARAWSPARYELKISISARVCSQARAMQDALDLGRKD